MVDMATYVKSLSKEYQYDLRQLKEEGNGEDPDMEAKLEAKLELCREIQQYIRDAKKHY